MAYSFSSSAANVKMMTCKHSEGFREIKPQITAIAKSFQWQSATCKIVMTKSAFPRKNESGNVTFEKGLQIFVYDNNQLKFICLPGWVCKPW